uniref:extracellular signal-regulated kinase 2-like isoform X1 n=2 Tax=Myxine glutinosa TaxID=7769 RepID=UPI00358FE600
MAAEVDYSGKIEPKILEKYKIMKCLGKGSYGIVWKGMHKLTGDIWAIKKNFDAFRNSTDAQRTYREITILRELHNHPNIIKLQDVIQAKGNKDIYLIFDCMDTDLHAVIKKRSILHDVHKRYILYQILKATKYIHSGNVIHRDLKPSNILLDSQCSVRLCDFGLARSLGQIEDEHCGLTQYVVTRWYRAPEIFLGCQYTKGVDMWSVGCILGEMLLGKALFPGTSAIHQMELIQRVTEPSKQDIDEVDKVFGRILSATKRDQTSLEELLPDAPPDALDLMGKLLVFNPEHRLTAEEALCHPYVSRFHDTNEPVLGHDVVLPVNDYTQLPVYEYRKLLNKLTQGLREASIREASGQSASKIVQQEPSPLHCNVDLNRTITRTSDPITHVIKSYTVPGTGLKEKAALLAKLHDEEPFGVASSSKVADHRRGRNRKEENRAPAVNDEHRKPPMKESLNK